MEGNLRLFQLPTEKPENFESHINQLRRLNIGELSKVSQKLVFAPPEDIQVQIFKMNQGINAVDKEILDCQLKIY